MRTDVFDPKLEDSYRLKHAIQLIQDQDTIISKQATDVQEHRNLIDKMFEANRKVKDLNHEANSILSTHRGLYY